MQTRQNIQKILKTLDRLYPKAHPALRFSHPFEMRPHLLPLQPGAALPEKGREKIQIVRR